MPTNPITRTEIVNVTETATNDYGDLIFHGTNGNEYKLSNKRTAMHRMVRPGFSVKLGFSIFNEKEYIATVSLVDVPQPVPKQNTPQKEAPQAPYKPSTTIQPVSGAEKGMILKEIGDNFRTGLFKQEQQPELWAFYKAELSRVTGVIIK